MALNISTAHVDAFSASVFDLAQQRSSRYRNRVTVETGVVGKSKSYDRVGTSEMQPITSRYGDSPLNDTPHSRRKVTFTDHDWGELVDDIDKIRTIIDPANAYNRAARYSTGRKIDDIVIAALDGAATDGDGNSVAFDTSTQIVAVDFVEDGAAVNSNLTVGKLREAKGLFLSNEVPDEEPLTIAVGASQIKALLRDDEVTSSDYAMLNALMRGDITGADYMGFHFIHSERQNVTGTQRHVNAWSQRALQLSFNRDVVGRISERPDKRFMPYVYFAVGLGAVRMDEIEVVRILCDEA